MQYVNHPNIEAHSRTRYSSTNDK